MLQPSSSPTVVTLPDGRRASITVTLLGDGWPSKVPLPTVPPTAPPPPPKAAKPPTKPAAKGKVVIKAKPKPILAAPQESGPAIDHPLIGGRLTAFVLFFGDYPDMHRRCVTSLLGTAGSRLEVRAYANAVGPESAALLDGLAAEGKIAHLYRSAENRKKGPALREMFHDPARPVTTPWVLYLDDDTFVDKDPRWLDRVCETVVAGAKADPRLGVVGVKQFYHVNPRQAAWLREADWFRGRPFCDRTGKEAPNGTAVHFVTGSFWAARYDCLKAADVPDPRLVHNGFDVCMGEQVRQAGYTMKALPGGGGKDLVAWSAVPRRGYREGIFGIK